MMELTKTEEAYSSIYCNNRALWMKLMKLRKFTIQTFPTTAYYKYRRNQEKNHSRH